MDRSKAPGPFSFMNIGLTFICVLFSAVGIQIDSPERNISAQSNITPNPARLSDTVSLTLNLDYAADLDVPTPVFADSLGDFRVSQITPYPMRLENGRKFSSWTISLTPEKPGTNEIGAIPILYRIDDQPESDWKTLVVPPQELEINSSVLGKSTLSEYPTLLRRSGFIIAVFIIGHSV